MSQEIIPQVVLFIAEGEVFQIKKSSHSKRIVKQLKKESLRGKSEEPLEVQFEVSFGTDQVCVCPNKGVLHLIIRLFTVGHRTRSSEYDYLSNHNSQLDLVKSARVHVFKGHFCQKCRKMLAYHMAEKSVLFYSAGILVTTFPLRHTSLYCGIDTVVTMSSVVDCCEFSFFQ